jgi:hypothetical protein
MKREEEKDQKGFTKPSEAQKNKILFCVLNEQVLQYLSTIRLESRRCFELMVSRVRRSTKELASRLGLS